MAAVFFTTINILHTNFYKWQTRGPWQQNYLQQKISIVFASNSFQKYLIYCTFMLRFRYHIYMLLLLLTLLHYVSSCFYFIVLQLLMLMQLLLLMKCIVPQNFSLLPFLYCLFVGVIRFITNRKEVCFPLYLLGQIVT